MGSIYVFLSNTLEERNVDLFETELYYYLWKSILNMSGIT